MVNTGVCGQPISKQAKHHQHRLSCSPGLCTGLHSSLKNKAGAAASLGLDASCQAAFIVLADALQTMRLCCRVLQARQTAALLPPLKGSSGVRCVGHFCLCCRSTC